VVGAPEDEQERELEQAAVPQGPRPSRSPTEGSAAVALAWEAGADGARRLLAYVAQEDQDLVSVVDVAAGREIAALPLAGGPTQVLVLEDGRVAVSLRWANAVALSSWDADAGLVEIGRFATAAEPLGLATTKDGARLLVVAGEARPSLLREPDLVDGPERRATPVAGRDGGAGGGSSDARLRDGVADPVDGPRRRPRREATAPRQPRPRRHSCASV
jgi:hypothetical protein